MGGAFVAYPVAGGGRFQSLGEHQTAGFVEAQFFLELQWRHASDLLEAVEQGGLAHVGFFCQLLHSQWFGVAATQGGDHPGNPVGLGVRSHELAHARAHLADQCPVDDFPPCQRCQHLNIFGGIQQAKQSVQGPLHAFVHVGHAQAATDFRARTVRVETGYLVTQFQHQVRHLLRVHGDLGSEIRAILAGIDDLPLHRQMHGTGQVAHGAIDNFPVAELNGLGALQNKNQ